MIFIYLAASVTVRPDYNEAAVKNGAPKMKKYRTEPLSQQSFLNRCTKLTIKCVNYKP